MRNCLIITTVALVVFACSTKDATREPGKSPDTTPTNKPPEDNPSKAPKFTFAATLQQQEEQLKTDPFMVRFRESRQKFANDPYRPIFHFVSPESNMNDPNGLCFWQGRWHLFYQGYPMEDPKRVHWGHTVSDDLVHWKDLPYAIYPNPEHSCFSGAAYVEQDRVIAMYHGTRIGNMVATSSDPLLLNWEKVTADRASIPITQPNGEPWPYRIFDPCIWKKDGIYYSLSAGRKQDPNGPQGRIIRANSLFRSTDLVSWEYLHPFVENDRFTLVGDDGACPYFWPIGDKHILPWFSHYSGGQYFLGDYDTKRDKFKVTSHGKFNFGAWNPGGVHAPSAAPDGEGGVIVIFNMNEAKPAEGWNRIMTLARQLTLIADDTLGIEPAGDIESLRYDHQQVEPMTLPANQEIVLENISGNAMEIIANIDPKEAPMIEMNVLRSPNKEEFTRIAFFKERGLNRSRTGVRLPPEENVYASLITLESSYSSVLPDVRSRGPETAPIALRWQEPLELRVFVDKSVVEVFVNGRQCVAMRVYPGLEESVGVSLRSQGQDSELLALEAYQMKSIYE